jgi:misacylated tRNA(Ala) deacylase
MPTKPLYLYDSYLKEFEARVEKAMANRVVLDQTAFHPLTGGVGYDTGFIRKENMQFRVVNVELNKETKEIVHILEEEADFKQGDLVQGIIDWGRRFKLMRLHTAAHLVAAILYRDQNALVTGGQVDTEYVKLDFNLPKTDREVFEAAVAKANQEASKDNLLKIYFVAREEALKMPGVVKLAERMPPKEKELRIVEIPDADLQADGGPHVKNTNEVGEIQLLRIENKGKNQRRAYLGVK